MKGEYTLSARLSQTSFHLFICVLAAFVWRLSDPGILNQLRGLGAIYLLLVLALARLHWP